MIDGVNISASIRNLSLWTQLQTLPQKTGWAPNDLDCLCNWSEDCISTGLSLRRFAFPMTLLLSNSAPSTTYYSQIQQLQKVTLSYDSTEAIICQLRVDTYAWISWTKIHSNPSFAAFWRHKNGPPNKVKASSTWAKWAVLKTSCDSILITWSFAKTFRETIFFFRGDEFHKNLFRELSRRTLPFDEGIASFQYRPNFKHVGLDSSTWP